jgi:hypothetical protein
MTDRSPITVTWISQDNQEDGKARLLDGQSSESQRGGADDPSNMQWQTVEDAKAKDRVGN